MSVSWQNAQELMDHIHSLNETFTNKMAVMEQRYDQLAGSMDHFFLIVMSIIVFFLQGGFALFECGAVRSKNTTNILIKNVLDSFVGALSYWIIGYALAFGGGGPFIGEAMFAHHGFKDDDYPTWFFQFVFAATAATIVSGSVAERCDFTAYLSYSVFITGFVYPVVTHWAWASEGWLNLGLEYCVEYGNTTGATCNDLRSIAYQDFAGSGVVHLVGGVAGFMGALALGPRIGRFNPDGTSNTIKGHSIPLLALGGIILIFGFFAFNGGSEGGISAPGSSVTVAVACINTIIGATGGAMTCLITNFIHNYFTEDEHHWSLMSTLNGTIIGMVSVCAGCNGYTSWASFVIGVVGGWTYLFWSWAVLKMKIDDPLDAFAVHAGGGMWGVIAAPIFKQQTGIIYNFDAVSFLGLGWNALGAIAIIGWTVVLTGLLFYILRALNLLRVSEEIEVKGLDIPKHGEPAYPVEAYGHGWGEKGDTLAMAFGGIMQTVATVQSNPERFMRQSSEKASHYGKDRHETAETHARTQHLDSQRHNRHSALEAALDTSDVAHTNPAYQPDINASRI